MSAGAGQVYSLVYSSTASQAFSDADLDALLAEARSFNSSHGITGILLYRSGRFVQFLEGEEQRVRALLDRIAADPRHRDVRVLTDGYTETRAFGAWTMGYETLGERSGPPPEGFRDTFDDLESLDDADAVLRATRELSMWFRARSARAA